MWLLGLSLLRGHPERRSQSSRPALPAHCFLRFFKEFIRLWNNPFINLFISFLPVSLWKPGPEHTVAPHLEGSRPSRNP